MRDFKIRAWYKPFGRMYYDVYKKPSYCGNKFITYEWYAISFNSSYEMKLSNKYIYLMRSSELIDRYNSEIYEGDIVEINGRLGYIKWDFKKAMFTIVTNEKKLMGYLNSYISSRCRIVGNVFDDEQLLYKSM